MRVCVRLLFLAPTLIVAAVATGPVQALALDPFLIETADGSPDDVGNYSSLALDSAGNPHIAYHNATTGNLEYARTVG